MASNSKAVTGTAVMARSANEKKKTHKVSTPKVPSQRRSTPLEPNFHISSVFVLCDGPKRRPLDFGFWSLDFGFWFG